MRALLVANGELSNSTQITRLASAADLIIAADGGAEHCNRVGITPHIVVGDLDSVSRELLACYQGKKVRIVRHPVRKNATDLELAMELAAANKAKELHVFAALGGRWDMSLANILLLAGARYRDMVIRLYGEDCLIQILHPGKNTITGRVGQTVSLIPLNGDATNVVLTGLEYPLTDQPIPFGSSIGVSNVLIKSCATVVHGQGILLCVQQYSMRDGGALEQPAEEVPWS